MNTHTIIIPGIIGIPVPPRLLASLLITALLIPQTGCDTDATIASRNLSKAADMFQINRRIVFYNGITNTYLLSIEGRCSIEPTKTQLDVTCKTGPDSYKKHFLGISDNVSYFAEQLDASKIDVYQYKVIFKPKAIIPDITIKTQPTQEASQ